MPLIESQPDALAQIYARSLLELAEAGGGQAAIEEALDELEQILELARHDHLFSEFLSSRSLSRDARAASLQKILKGRASDLTLRFLQVVNDKGRMSHLPAIVAALDSTVQSRFGRVEVDVYTAAPMSADEQRAIKTRLQSALGKEPILHPYIDPTMIGGLRIQIGDQLIDASLSTQLRKLRDRLNTEGAATLRAQADRAIEG